MGALGTIFTRGQKISIFIIGIIVVILNIIFSDKNFSNSDIAELVPFLITLVTTAILLIVVVIIIGIKNKINVDLNIIKLIRNNWLIVIVTTIIVLGLLLADSNSGYR